MTFEVVISPFKDEKINSHINESEIWKEAYTPEEFTPEILRMHPAWFSYTIQFDGLKPVQCTKTKVI